MKLSIPALAVALPLTFSPLSALAAPPTSFSATGTALVHADGQTPETRMPVKVFYQQGKMRLEMKTPGNVDSVILSQQGESKVTLLDPVQKLAFTIDPGAMGLGGQASKQKLMDLTSWKSTLQTQGKKLPGKQTFAGQACSLWQTTEGNTTTKVWFADSLELPMQFESSVNGKPAFTFTVQTIDTKGGLAETLFRVPAGFTQTELQGN